jgi:hypothetical protein
MISYPTNAMLLTPLSCSSIFYVSCLAMVDGLKEGGVWRADGVWTSASFRLPLRRRKSDRTSYVKYSLLYYYRNVGDTQDIAKVTTKNNLSSIFIGMILLLYQADFHHHLSIVEVDHNLSLSRDTVDSKDVNLVPVFHISSPHVV